MENKCNIRCRQCPGRNFELIPVMKANFGPSRFMGICHALNLPLVPSFKNNTLEDALLFINKANIGKVEFEPVDNCPHIEELRQQGLIPWATATIDFLNHKRRNHEKVF